MLADHFRNDTTLNFTEKYNVTGPRMYGTDPYAPLPDYYAYPLPANYTRTRTVNCSDHLDGAPNWSYQASPVNCILFNETTPDYNNTGRWD